MSTILDVAREAKVAASTVSRVVHGNPRISASTQQRVHEAMRRVGYQPHAGRARRRQRAWHLAVLYTPHMLVNGAMADTCRDWIVGVREQMLDAGGHLEILAGANHVDQDTMYHHCLGRSEIHGLIFVGAPRETGYLDDLARRDLPVVMIGDRPPSGTISSVYADLYGAGRSAVEHLLSLGHRRIALGHLPAEVSWSQGQRRLGALEALHAAGLEPVVDRLADRSFDDLSYFDEGAQLLVKQRATGLLCGDFAAVRYIEALSRRGLRVPQDFCVVGCENAGIKPATGQALTTIDFDKPAMGRLAATTLMQLINHRAEIRHMELSVPTRLVIQQTTGPAPA